MSRVGQSPVVVPDGVSIEILDGILTAKGKLGAQSLPISGEVNVAIVDNIVTVSPKNQSKRSRSMWGTTRARINNMLFKFENLFLIHFACGPIAIKNKKAITTGMITEL